MNASGLLSVFTTSAKALRIFSAMAALICGSVPSAFGQTVQIQNLSYPGTGLEPGDTVGISITGASASSAVTVIVNGGSPVLEGYTDGSGNFSLMNTVESGDVNSWTEDWYVASIAMTPDNLSSYFAPFAPSLPGTFYVSGNYTGSNYPAHSTADGISCISGDPGAYYWTFTPVAYYNYSTLVSGSAVDAAAENWNDVQSAITLENNNSGAISIFDGDGYGVLGNTQVYSGNCSPCAGYIDQCSDTCLNNASIWDVSVTLDGDEITGEASTLGTDTATLGSLATNHELGHVLRFADVAPSAHARCSEVQSIMFGSGSMLFGCGFTSPLYSDGELLEEEVYPSGASACSPIGSNWCYTSESYECS